MVKKKGKSKRMTLKQKYKIERKVGKAGSIQDNRVQW